MRPCAPALQPLPSSGIWEAIHGEYSVLGILTSSPGAIESEW